MKLTPVNTPGKRRRNDTVAIQPNKKQRVKHTSRRRDQLLPQSKLSDSMKNASPLELMPLEILERIFWFSGNINLPRASHKLGRFLSGIETRHCTFIYAFRPSWDAWFGLPALQGWTAPVLEGDPEFQSQLLQYSWVNIHFILDCWDFYVKGRFYKERSLSPLIDPDGPFAFHLHHVRLWGDPIESVAVLKAENHYRINPEKASDCFWHDYSAFGQYELSPVDLDRFLRNVPSFIRSNNNSPTHSFLQVHRDTRIPDELLSGPWDIADLQKLFWLVRGGASLSPDQTWELTYQGLRTAMYPDLPKKLRQCNRHVVRILMLLRAFQAWPQHLWLEVEQQQNAYVEMYPAAYTEDPFVLAAMGLCRLGNHEP
ncbi:hypothetical protein M426DRAFT_316941 [Hypoxylon sp. CI-4A]|nr:hypothetical protein M426DRAFT_316941 [Hypoxylon sp. CI-4A]